MRISFRRVMSAVLLAVTLITLIPGIGMMGIASATVAGYDFEEVGYGSEGNVVKQLQKRLIDLNYLSGYADGIYGNSTEEAVMAFQEANDLEQTGIATIADQEVLFDDDIVIPAEESRYAGYDSGESETSSSSGGAYVTYVLNTNTMKFHMPDCRYVGTIADKNRRDVDISRSEIISEGYVPCKVCDP